MKYNKFSTCKIRHGKHDGKKSVFGGSTLRELSDNTVFHLTHNYLALRVALLCLCSEIKM